MSSTSDIGASADIRQVRIPVIWFQILKWESRLMRKFIKADLSYLEYPEYWRWPARPFALIRESGWGRWNTGFYSGNSCWAICNRLLKIWKIWSLGGIRIEMCGVWYNRFYSKPVLTILSSMLGFQREKYVELQFFNSERSRKENDTS